MIWRISEFLYLPEYALKLYVLLTGPTFNPQRVVRRVLKGSDVLSWTQAGWCFEEVGDRR